jgi:hypothetical protein
MIESLAIRTLRPVTLLSEKMPPPQGRRHKQALSGGKCLEIGRWRDGCQFCHRSLPACGTIMGAKRCIAKAVRDLASRG